MRAILFILLWVACAAAFSATVYRWVDENGVTHYSDQPHEGAEKVTVSAPQTYSAPRQASPSNNSASRPAAPAQTYSCEITQPANDDFLSVVSWIAADNPSPEAGPLGGDGR